MCVLQPKKTCSKQQKNEEKEQIGKARSPLGIEEEWTQRVKCG
jgi:hypothetical protein